MPAPIAAEKTVTLAMNPAVGGIPASESRNRAISAARPGLLRASPAYASSEVCSSPRADTSIKIPNEPTVMIE